MGFPLPWPHGYSPSASSVEGTELVYDTTIEETDVGRLLFQFRGKPRIEALISELCAGRLGRLELALWQCLVERRIDTAIGASLEVLGRTLGVDRAGRADPRLRRRVRAEILVLRSSGSADELTRIAWVYLGTETGVALEEIPPAAARVDLEAAIDGADALELAMLYRRAKGAGVRLTLEWSEVAPASTFGFSLAGDFPEESAGKGFGSTTDATLGGDLPGVFG